MKPCQDSQGPERLSFVLPRIRSVGIRSGKKYGGCCEAPKRRPRSVRSGQVLRVKGCPACSLAVQALERLIASDIFTRGLPYLKRLCSLLWQVSKVKGRLAGSTAENALQQGTASEYLRNFFSKLSRC